MSDPTSSNPIEDPALFLEKLDKCLSPHLQECFSEESKKLRNALLSVGLLLFLLAYGTVSFAGQGDFAGLKFEQGAKGALKAAAGAIELFFLVVYAVRCFVEWTAWKLKNLSPEWSLLALHEQLSSSELRRIEEGQTIRAELTSLVMRGRYGRETNELSTKLAENSGGAVAERQRAMSSLLTDYLPRVQIARRCRFWFEAVFPVVFGGLSVLSAFFPSTFLIHA